MCIWDLDGETTCSWAWEVYSVTGGSKRSSGTKSLLARPQGKSHPKSILRRLRVASSRKYLGLYITVQNLRGVTYLEPFRNLFYPTKPLPEKLPSHYVRAEIHQDHHLCMRSSVGKHLSGIPVDQVHETRVRRELIVDGDSMERSQWSNDIDGQKTFDDAETLSAMTICSTRPVNN